MVHILLYTKKYKKAILNIEKYFGKKSNIKTKIVLILLNLLKNYGEYYEEIEFQLIRGHYVLMLDEY